MSVLKLNELTRENKPVSTLTQLLKPIKANKEILNIHHYFLKALQSLNKKPATALESPFSLFSQQSKPKTSPLLSLNFTIPQPTEIIDKITEIGKVESVENPLTDFIKSLSPPVTPAVSETAGCFQFSSEVIASIKENKDYTTLRIKRPADWNFFPGQYLEIRGENSSANKPAILAIASGVTDEYIEITAKPNSNPDHANYCLNSLPGEYLTVTGPHGSNFPVDAIQPDSPVLILGGGSGLTALKSLMDSLPYGSNSKLIYSSKSSEELIYRDEIEEWKQQGHTISLTQEEKEGFEHGRITEHLKNMVIETNTLVFLCGPKELVIETARYLAERGVPKELIFGSLPAMAKDGGPVYRGDHPKMLG